MTRTLVAISILLVAVASVAAEPPDAGATGPEATASANTPAPTDTATPAATPSAESVAAAAAATPPAAPSEAQPTAAAAPTVAADVPTVEIKKLADDTICRNERPTGSQIGIRRCYSRRAAQTQSDEIMRRDIEEMRARQNDQQAREAAAAMTRRRAGL